jgi:hypothetical protein
MTDEEAYKLYPHDTVWYNKLFLASILNYNAGYGYIPYDGKFIVRPIVNLQGCGIGARIANFKKGDPVPHDYFWCEVFTGRHITIDYSKINGRWQQGNTFEGFKDDLENLLQFSLWQRVNYPYELPTLFDAIHADKLNIEIIDNKIIEVHLRHNTDPVNYDFFIPIWSKDQRCPDNCIRIDDHEDHPGRLGFYVRNN